MAAEPVTLPHKPGAALAINFTPPSPPRGAHSSTLVVFVNGLGLPRASWSGVVDHLATTHRGRDVALPATLRYDRFGQGDSDPDPTDPPGTPYGHEAPAIVSDLHALLTHVASARLSLPLGAVRLVLVGNSIGCPLSRLYAAAHPGSVSALVFLDSMMAHTDFVSLFPDPDDPSFDPAGLPEGVSAGELRAARERTARHFHPTVPNAERFDRRNLAALVPRPDEPRLPDGPGGRPPALLVVGHDPDTFAEQSAKGSMAIPKALTNAYTNPAWHAYNEGLTRLVGGGNLKIAKGCGHFIQKDDPVFVADELSRVLERIAV